MTFENTGEEERNLPSPDPPPFPSRRTINLESKPKVCRIQAGELAGLQRKQLRFAGAISTQQSSGGGGGAEKKNLEHARERSERASEGMQNVQATYLILSGTFLRGCGEEGIEMT